MEKCFIYFKLEMFLKLRTYRYCYLFVNPHKVDYLFPILHALHPLILNLLLTVNLNHKFK